MGKADIAVLEEMAERTEPNQVGPLFSTFGILSSRPFAGEVIDFLMNGVETPVRDQPLPRAMEVMAKLEAVAKQTKTPPRSLPKFAGGWHAAERFASEVSGLYLHDYEAIAPLLKAAYKNEGLNTNFRGISDLFRFITDSRYTDQVFLALTGKEPETPRYEERNKLVAFVGEKIRQGWSSRDCCVTADMINTLLDLEAPRELLRSVHSEVQRQGQPNIWEWRLRPRDVVRYHLASSAEKEYIRTVIETDKLWEEYSQYHHFAEGIDNPGIYKFLTEQIKRKASADEIGRMSRTLREIEEHSDSVGLLGVALTGKKTSLDELLEHLGTRDLRFLGGEEAYEYEGSQTPLPSIVQIAQRKPNIKVMQYLRQAVEADCAPNDIARITTRFSDWSLARGDSPNPGRRAHFASCCYGARFAANKQAHQPHTPNIESRDRLERSVAALNFLYDASSEMNHAVVRGKYTTENQSCHTAAFVNNQDGVMHVVFPNSMMFDPEVTEQNCGGCPTLQLCRGMEEYQSAVLFDPTSFDEGYLEHLAKTVPGAFELHSDERGLHKLGIFALFPKQMSLVYYNPMIAKNGTPINTGKPFQRMIIFPYNINGSAYLTNSLRTRTISGDESKWLVDETVTVIDSDFKDENFPALQNKMTHLIGREITIAPRYFGSEISYHPSIPSWDLAWKLVGTQGFGINRRDSLIIEPVHPRTLTQPKQPATQAS